MVAFFTCAVKLMRDWFKRIGSLLGVSASSTELPPDLLSQLGIGQASELRPTLQSAMAGNPVFSVPALLEQARLAGWGAGEQQKLAIYADFFSGQSSIGYQRLMDNAEARLDFDLFMTAMTYCYKHDRFAEGYQLLKSFELDRAQRLDLSEYYPCAAYAAFNGGGTVHEAAGYLEQALNEGLHTALVVVNAYVIFFEAGLLERLAELNRLIRNNFASDTEAIYTLGNVELGRDYYPEGFRLMEARYHRPETLKWLSPTLIQAARWQRKPLAGKRLFIHGEQGVGDALMMARYLSLLEQQGAKVILECPDSVSPLLAHNFPGCELVPLQVGKEIEQPFDFWTGMMSLPFHFNTTADNVPCTAGYLSVPPEQAAYWHDRVKQLNVGRRPKVGIAWSGNPRHRFDRRRSITFEKLVPHLRAVSQVQFFALQTDLPTMGPAQPVNVSDELLTFADTAALIAEMDLVITVDTSTVHLAGALGKQTWLLLPYRYEWRWSLAGENNNWYDTVKVIRQRTSGNWDELLSDLFQHRLPSWIEDMKTSGTMCV